MAGSSPAPRRSYQWSSPQRNSIIDEILNDERNSEARHRVLIDAARKEHERVRGEAERVYQDHLRREEQQKLAEERRREEERIRRDEQLAAERMRLLALKEKKVKIPEVPPTPVKPDPPKASGPRLHPELVPAPPNNGLFGTTTSESNSLPAAQPTQPALQVNGSTTKSTSAATSGPLPPVSSLFGAPKLQQSSQTLSPNPLAAPKPAISAQPAPAPTPAAPASIQVNGVSGATITQQPPAPPVVDRYTVIHKNLKDLRKSLAEQAKINKGVKDRMGDMRREIRKCLGQLTNGAGANRIQQQKIVAILREGLANLMQSQLLDPSEFVAESRNPVPGASHNEAQLPSIFLYLLNIFAKTAISQFISEAGPRPETADPIGVCVAATFSEPDFGWRGASLIDILLAKFRIVCPVLFGFRGSEKTEQGRARLGWWKDNGRWVPEQQHMDRMTGLGAGFAAVSLRKFAKSNKENPYPPRHYWTAMAKIVNTPPAEMSNTQCVVLKSMIQNYEQKFIEYYGNAAIAALKLCLVDFPARAIEKSAAVNSLEVLAQLLKRDSGLVLR